MHTSVLFKTRIVSKPRYVRVPLQMYNGVRELKTDVYFPRLLQQYQQNIELMQRLLPDERICHLRADVHGIKDWQRTYERFTCAFRSLNVSRIIRRMHITGFRIVDIVGAEKPFPERVCFRTGNSGGFLQSFPDFPDCVSSRATIWLIGSELFPDCVSGLRCFRAAIRKMP